jgi:hypothetical protein
MNQYTIKGIATLGGLLLIGLLIVGKQLWGEREPAPASKDTSRCPDCGRELPGQAKVTGECPYCKLAQRRTDQDGEGQPSGSETSVRPLAVVLGMFVVGAAGAYIYLRRKKTQPVGPNMEFSTFRCPSCKRKLRFCTTKAGQKGLCPGCRRICIFPGTVRSGQQG